MFPTRSCVRCAEPRPGWQASPKPGEYAPLPHNSLVLLPPSNSKTKLTKTARSSSASSQPRKPASSIPRSVFGRVPSWPPSSMIREVCVFSQWAFLVLGPASPSRCDCLFLSFTLSLPLERPLIAPWPTSIPFFFRGGQRAEGMHGGGARVPLPVSLPT